MDPVPKILHLTKENPVGEFFEDRFCAVMEPLFLLAMDLIVQQWYIDWALPKIQSMEPCMKQFRK